MFRNHLKHVSNLLGEKSLNIKFSNPQNKLETLKALLITHTPAPAPFFFQNNIFPFITSQLILTFHLYLDHRFLSKVFESLISSPFKECFLICCISLHVLQLSICRLLHHFFRIKHLLFRRFLDPLSLFFRFLVL